MEQTHTAKSAKKVIGLFTVGVLALSSQIKGTFTGVLATTRALHVD